MMTKYVYQTMKCLAMTFFVLNVSLFMTSCSDDYMEDVNTDDSKAKTLDPNAQLTTALLQTYGDFSMMDTYRSYITGFTQYYAGGWNVTAYAGSVHANNDQTRLVWDRFYSVAIKNLADAMINSADKPNLNAVLRIHRVYLMSVLTDIYGDIPCSEAGLGYSQGISMPKYDNQKDIYDYFFTELAACVDQLSESGDRITGDVTSMAGDITSWKKYANSLRMRFAMRISDINETKAREEFEKAMRADGGYISSSADDAYIRYTDSPFTLYDGAQDLDFRVNALGEILYGQDPTSPTFVCATLFNMMNDLEDPRLYRICRHYLNVKRSEVAPDTEWNVDVTDEVVAYLQRSGAKEEPCNPGAAWWNNWIAAPSNSEIPTLERLVATYPEAGFDANNFNARMMRPFLSIDFEQPNRPGILFTSAETELLLAEAYTKHWTVPGTDEDHFEAGVRAAMELLNRHYLSSDRVISEDEITTYVNKLLASGALTDNAREAINTQAWLLHLTNPSEGWANLRRSDYPVLMDRSKLEMFGDFTYDDPNLTTPVRLRYPTLEYEYNTANYEEAVKRIGTLDDKGNYIDDWHHRVWWDVDDINVK